mgnify:CR=1 FL=1
MKIKKILWVCNKKPSIVSKIQGEEIDYFGGWIDSMCNKIITNKKIFLCVTYPDFKEERGEENNFSFYSFIEKKLNLYFKNILEKESPDIIHVWGTEFSHSNEILKICQELGIIEKCVISIQGLVSLFGKRHYVEGIPCKIIKRYTLRDFIKKDNIQKAREKFLKCGEQEIEALKRAKHIIGRTDWDKAALEMFNPNAKYYFCNESLRESFYNHIWDINKVEKYSIFVSQCSYPVKGFHYMLEAMPEILRKYPKAHLYTTGKDLLHLSFKEKLLISSYQLYIFELIKKYNLENHVTFLGMLSEEKMCERYLKSNVFVSASTIENSSNSVGEAMILGCPVVSSDVGGVKNILSHEKEGFIYQSSAPYMLAYYVKKIFENDSLAMEVSKNARKHAIQVHDRESNINTLYNIYEEIINKKIMVNMCVEEKPQTYQEFIELAL